MNNDRKEGNVKQNNNFKNNLISHSNDEIDGGTNVNEELRAIGEEARNKRKMGQKTQI